MFKETAQALNAIHILDRNFTDLLNQCNEVREEIQALRLENEKLKQEIKSLKLPYGVTASTGGSNPSGLGSNPSGATNTKKDENITTETTD